MTDAAAPADRLVIHDLQASHLAGAIDEAMPRADFASAFAADVRRGLTAMPKRLPPKYFYDELGSLLFEAVCLTPEYYVTRAEDEIFAAHAGDIVCRAVGEGGGNVTASLALLELGSGSATKTARLIEAILLRQNELHYRSIDISAPVLERAARVLLQSYPSLHITAYAADYQTALRTLAASPSDAGASPALTLALFLGSNIGNFTRAEAVEFLRDLRGVLKTGDALLVGADLRKNSAVLEAAYDDALGITAAFNLNLLVRINRELGGDFQLDYFRHVAIYNDAEGLIEMHIASTRKQIVRLARLDLAIGFAADEHIHTENSYKYDLAELDCLAASAGFVREHTWFDRAERFSSNLFRAVE